MKSLIIGAGEVGMALARILKCDFVDKGEKANYKPEVIHICFRYSKEFIKEVKRYQKVLRPKYTVIHSTVPVGTSRKCESISSPVIGFYPELEKSLRTFTKFLGGEKASEVADYFRRCGFKVYLFKDPETPELMKLLDTTFYGVCAEYAKDVNRECKKNNVPFEAWTIWTDNYNLGYQKLGYPEYTRPNLIPIMTKLGGHCVLSNCDLISTKFTKLLKEI